MSLPGVLDLGRRPFGEVEALQEARRDRILAGDRGEERVLIVEHDPVVTLGRRAGTDELRVPEASLAARGIALHRASRGGEATYHGPGQLVAYPIVTLRRGVVAHVEALAAAAVAVAASLGIEARYDRARPGVWVGPRKLASIGVHVRRRVAIHGLALNVTGASLAGFDAIVPCGMPDVQMTSLESELGAAVDMSLARDRYVAALLRLLPTCTTLV